jgi:hypothetical protein
MGARIIQLAEFRARRAQQASNSLSVSEASNFAERFHFWSGASGRRYVHTIYSLVECPDVAAGNYMLVRRGSDGRRHVLAVGRVSHAAGSLNLAEIRHHGAQLGADEVHVHLLAESPAQCRLVELDLRSGQLPPASGGHATVTRH